MTVRKEVSTKWLHSYAMCGRRVEKCNGGELTNKHLDVRRKTIVRQSENVHCSYPNTFAHTNMDAHISQNKHTHTQTQHDIHTNTFTVAYITQNTYFIGSYKPATPLIALLLYRPHIPHDNSSASYRHKTCPLDLYTARRHQPNSALRPSCSHTHTLSVTPHAPNLVQLPCLVSKPHNHTGNMRCQCWQP